MRVEDDANDGIGTSVSDIAELSGGRLAGVVTADDQAEVNLAGHADGIAAQQCPGLAIIAGVACKKVTSAFEPQPHRGKVRWETSGGSDGVEGWIAPGEIAAIQAGGGEGGGKAAGGIESLTRHQAGFGPQIRRAQASDAARDVEVAAAELVVEIALVR